MTENLKEAVAGETHEFKSMYPAMIADAQAEGREAGRIERHRDHAVGSADGVDVAF